MSKLHPHSLFSNSFIIHHVKTEDNYKYKHKIIYFSVYSFVFVSIEKIYQTLETVSSAINTPGIFVKNTPLSYFELSSRCL